MIASSGRQRTPRGRLSRRRFVRLAGGAVLGTFGEASLLHGGTTPAEAREAPRGAPGNILRSGHPGEPDSLDPHLAIAAPSLVVINDLFEGLLTLDARGRPTPGCAERWTISPGGRVWRFTLREGLLWSDGSKLTAEDFVYAWRRLADPGTAASGLASFLDLLEGGAAILRGQADPTTLGVEAIDSRTVQVRLAQAAPYFASVVSLPAFAPVSRRAIEAHGRAWTRPENFVGNGAYRLAEWRPGQFVRSVRNLRFHGASEVRIDGVIYRAINDQNAGLRLFQAGELDALTNFPPERLDWLRVNMPRELRLSPSLGVTVYVFNHRLPKFRDPRVRRALGLAVDRDVLTTRLLKAGDRPAWGLVPSGLPDYPPALVAPGSMSSRLAEARSLLAAAGYSSANPLELDLLYHTSEEHKKVAVAVTSMWQALGVRARLRNAERQVVEVATRNGDFEIARAAWFSSYPDPLGFLGYLREGSPANGGAYRDAEFESLVAAAAQNPNAAERLAILRRAERRLIEDQAVIPLYFLVSRRLVAQRVIGWRDDNLSALRSARWLALRA